MRHSFLLGPNIWQNTTIHNLKMMCEKAKAILDYTKRTKILPDFASKVNE